jgi:adenylosuccinate synthase
MPATIIMGGQWGDEGKGKLTDALAGRADMVVRANGGSNAGHTVKTNRGTFKLHLVPSGILYPDVDCIIGAGVVVDPSGLVRELETLRAQGIDTGRLRISSRAHVVLPYHAEIDRAQESRLENNKIGTTLRGIGPAYADKAYRHGMRIGELLRATHARERIRQLVDEKNALLSGIYGSAPLDAEQIADQLLSAAEELRPFISETEPMVYDKLSSGGEVLVECAQGAMLDIDYGTYPYVTSSSPSAAGACQGAGIPPTKVARVIAVFKAYSTRVGSGPFPTELLDETGNLIRERGREYGTTTGRPRRVGWFDAVAARHTIRLNGVTEIAMTLVDVLDVFDEVQVCRLYRTPDGNIIDYMPSAIDDLVDVRPDYQAQRGWNADITGARLTSELPMGAIGYARSIEQQIGAPITMMGVGPDREQLVALTESAAIASLAV